VNIGGEDRYHNRDETPRGDSRVSRHHDQYPKSGLEKSAEVNKLKVPGQVRRHDVHVEIGIDEMVDAQRNKHYAQQIFHRKFELAHTQSPPMVIRICPQSLYTTASPQLL